MINLCERVILLESGKIIFDGEPIDWVSEYTKMIHNDRFREADGRVAKAVDIEIASHDESNDRPKSLPVWICSWIRKDQKLLPRYRTFVTEE